MKTRLSFIAALGVYCFALVANADAQQIKADTGGIAIGGNVTNSTIGISNELLAALVRQVGDPSEAQKTKLEGELDLNQRQIHAAPNILDEKDFPPARLGAKLVEIAERFKALQATASAQPGDDPRIVALKGDAEKAIDQGELAKADAMLAEVETEQRRALDRLAVNAAEHPPGAARSRLLDCRTQRPQCISPMRPPCFPKGALTTTSGSAISEKRQTRFSGTEMNLATMALGF